MILYLTTLDIIISTGGTVDKYIGDAIMAFWNAPEAVDNHPIVACQTALDYMNQLENLHKRWAVAGLPKLNCRIGISTGKCLVGNMGSSVQMSYTALGDNVNIASRLEALNKTYGTRIMITGEVYDIVSDLFLCR